MYYLQSRYYDPAIGNPLSYYNGNSYTFTWQNGRRLAAAAVGETTVSFTYNDDGIRTSKTVNGEKHVYRLDGSRIIAEEESRCLILYLYDGDGSPIGMQYRNSAYGADIYDTYWFEKNLQGDIVAVYDEDGTKLIAYTYDAWGNVTTTYFNGGASSTARFNPFRYRGYYYDTELEMYYLQSRYYDPAIGRFINADAYASTGQGVLGYNMFSYCLNNPTNMVDTLGMAPQFILELLEQFAEWVVTPLGALQYTFKYTSKGELYEFWVDSNNKIKWCRHHSQHGNKKTHPFVLHDHRWYDDDDGNNTQDPTPLPPNSGFQAPGSDSSHDDVSRTVAGAVGTVALGYMVYLGAKWIIAGLTAVPTGGGSLIIAGVTP